jgi:tetratricopeptide (TPR) repeat protein
VWVSFFLGAAGAAVVVKAWLPKIGEPDTDRESAGVAVAASLSMADDQESLGDLEQAATAVDRAVRAAPHDPLVLAARAKLAVERAEGAWLRRRATPAANRDASEDNDFVRLAADARGMAEDAFRALPNSDDARRTLVNALRIFGEVDRARDVARGLGDVTSAESMYALGAIDVAASKIGPETVQHLRESTWAGGVPGKGRAALAFALARTGDIAGARAELDKLALLARPHPAMTALRAIVDDADAQRAAKPPPAPKRNKAPKTCPDESRSKHRDTATILLDAAAARCRGDFEGARKLYLSVLDGAPEDSEALSGMGDVARQEDDWDTARTYYGRALRANPAFLPAALGAADVEWDVGSFAIAQRKYREILAASPDATLPPRVKERATIALPGSSNGAG